MYIYETDLYLYENVYRSINQSTMYFTAERSKLELGDVFFIPNSSSISSSSESSRQLCVRRLSVTAAFLFTYIDVYKYCLLSSPSQL